MLSYRRVVIQKHKIRLKVHHTKHENYKDDYISVHNKVTIMLCLFFLIGCQC